MKPLVRASQARSARFGFAAVVCGALCIAFAPIFVRLSELPPAATGFQRMLLAIPLYVVWMALEGRRERAQGMRNTVGNETAGPPGAETSSETVWWRAVWRGLGMDRRLLLGVVVAGLFFAGDMASWHFSIRYTSVANATLLPNMAPVVVTLFAWLLFKERITGRFIMGLVLALAGAALLVLASSEAGGSRLLGDALASLTAFFYAGYLLTVKNLRNHLSTARLMGMSTLVSCLALLLLAVALGEPLFPTTLRGWLVVLGLAWTAQVAGQGLIAFGMAHLPASFSSVTLLVQPVAATFLGWAILGEGVVAWQVLGGGAVLAGILLARGGGRAGYRPATTAAEAGNRVP